MTEPRPSRPVPSPPPSEPAGEQAASTPAPREAGTGQEDREPGPFADLQHLPVADHVAVFEAEHSRLQDELSTIDEV